MWFGLFGKKAISLYVRFLYIKIYYVIVNESDWSSILKKRFVYLKLRKCVEEIQLVATCLERVKEVRSVSLSGVDNL